MEWDYGKMVKSVFLYKNTFFILTKTMNEKLYFFINFLLSKVFYLSIQFIKNLSYMHSY